ncbi:MAG: hypothetical protein ABIJ65_04495 [Chloroflexota bacterium]
MKLRRYVFLVLASVLFILIIFLTHAGVSANATSSPAAATVLPGGCEACPTSGIASLYCIGCCRGNWDTAMCCKYPQAADADICKVPNSEITPTPTPEQEQISITVSADGYAFKVFTFTSAGPISSFEIEGHVVDEKGNGIAYANVKLNNSSMHERTDADGYFNISGAGKTEGIPFSVSQNYELISNLFTSEILEKDAKGNPYKGISADGVSFLTLQIKVPAGMDPMDVKFQCDAYNAREAGDFQFCSPGLVKGNIIETTITAYEEFIWPYDIDISVQNGTGDSVELPPINVIHPPVVLIHGVWSGRGSMIPGRNYLDNTGHFSYVLTADYSATSYDDIRNNVGTLRTSVDLAFRQLEINGYLGQRVDIVAHSMGGLISRLYMLGYTSPDGSAVPGQAQNVRKLITLSTPHQGSTLGDWYSELDPPNMFYCPAYGFGLIKEGTHEPYKDEYDHALNVIRSKMGLRSDALTFGEGVRQLATLNNPVLDDLNARQRVVGNQDNEFYFLAGEKSFYGEKTGNWLTFMGPPDFYPYHPASTNPPEEAKVGPCGQTEMSEPFRKMMAEFFAFTTAKDSDGVVQVTSSLGNGIGIRPVVAETVPFNHFSITEAGPVWMKVYKYLTGVKPEITGSYFYKGSPGTLNVYDEQGRHVGPDEISIPGATYEEFEDVTGGHTLIYVPEGGQFTVNVDVAEAGKVTLEVNQGGADGWRWTRYEDIAVEPGSQIELNYDRDNPQGQVVNANGETISLVPTYHEIISDVQADTLDDILNGIGTGLQSLWFIGLLILVFLVGIGAVLIIWKMLRKRRKPQPLSIQSGDQDQPVQDSQGYWWYQNKNTGIWNFWNGKVWQPAPGTESNIFAPHKFSPKKPRSGGSCLLSLLIGAGMGLAVVGGISLIGLQFVPGYQIIPRQGDLIQILKMGGGGLLLTLLGFFLLNGGFKAISSRRVMVEDEYGNRREKRGCGAILQGLTQLLIGVVCIVGGFGLMTLVFYQEVLPWLGY